MSRIPLVEPEHAPAEVRALYESLSGGTDLPVMNVMKLFGNNVDLLTALTHLAGALYQRPRLSPRYRELAYLRASQLNSCHY
jgi:alkylhydroperoxidase family enzyme